MILIVEGYGLRERQNWGRTRFLGYMIYRSVADSGKAVSLYEFMPLEGDPTVEEQKRFKDEELKAEQEYLKGVFKNYRERGLN